MIPKNIERRIRQHVQAMNNDFFAIVQPGFEEMALQEILHAGAALLNVKTITGGIEFTANIKDVWNLNFTSRCLTRILMRIGHFRALYFEKFHEKIESIPWELYLQPGHMPGFSVTCKHSRLYNQGRLEEECAKGILKHMNKVYPKVTSHKSSSGETQTVFVRFEDDVCTISIDTSGEPLYKRGFRTHVAEAPMRETLASCILHAAEIETFEAVLDPMCGSGVIPLEAAMISKGICAGTRRKFAFEDWPGHRVKAFEYSKRTITNDSKTTAPKFAVYASDIDEKNIEITRHNSEQSDVAEDIHISRADFFSLKREDFPESKLLIAFNPPYGGRISVEDISKLYRRIGMKLRKDFSGSLCAIIVPGHQAEKALGISPQKRIPFINGGIRVVLVIGVV